jgi:uncharacterized protein YbaP (TraB family)
MGRVIDKLAQWLGVKPATGYRYPAMDITLNGGQQLHLVGSLHMGSAEMSPLPPSLIAHLTQADALVVEADIYHDQPQFPVTEVLSPLAQRLTTQSFQQLQQLCEKLHISLSCYSTLPCWQVALSLQATQAQRLGLRGEYGIDYQLIQMADQKQIKIIELEGAQLQISFLEQLENEGQALLEDTLTHWHNNAQMLQIMMGWWISGKQHQQCSPGEKCFPSIFSDGLYDTLMQQRNLRWQTILTSLPAGKYVVAVGALHLYGDNNLPQML